MTTTTPSTRNSSGNSIMEPIVWDDIDKKKYYFYGPTLFMGVRALVYPNNLVKTRLQVQGTNRLYNGTFDAFRKIVKYEGMRGLYKGFGTNMLNVITGNLYITSYELSRKFFLENDVEPFWANFMGGTCASLISQTIVVPLDVISQHLMMQGQSSSRYGGGVGRIPTTTTHEQARGTISMAKYVIRNHGVSGLFRGYGLSVATYAPSSTIWWGTYGFLFPTYYEAMPDTIEPNTRRVISTAAAGCTSGLLAAFITNPLDVLRTRAQVHGDESFRITLKKLLEEDGKMGFFNGVRARMIAMGSSGILVISTYELVKRLSLKDEFAWKLEAT